MQLLELRALRLCQKFGSKQVYRQGPAQVPHPVLHAFASLQGYRGVQEYHVTTHCWALRSREKKKL